MKSRTTREFRSCFAHLPKEVQRQAYKTYRTWLQNPNHRGLHYKRVGRIAPVYSVRIGRGWRALGLLEADTVYWFWIGTHAAYDDVIRRW